MDLNGHGIQTYDLAGNFCEECGRAKSFRLWPGTLTGCKTCDDVITRHRCTRRPAIASLEPGAAWTCPDCGTVWTVAETEDRCGECWQPTGTVKTWESVPGDRIDSAPRYDPPPLWTPFRDALPRRHDPPGSFGPCYVMAGGQQVHVRPGCTCK